MSIYVEKLCAEDRDDSKGEHELASKDFGGPGDRHASRTQPCERLKDHGDEPGEVGADGAGCLRAQMLSRVVER